jgi:hypothetical protein
LIMFWFGNREAISLHIRMLELPVKTTSFLFLEGFTLEIILSTSSLNLVGS